ncbi:hypothetical protein Tco_0307346 [Tanacetum coccineum]
MDRSCIWATTTAVIKGKGDVYFEEMSSEKGKRRVKSSKLTKVLYVTEIRKILVFDWAFLNIVWFSSVLRLDKIGLSKNQMFVGRVYAIECKDEAIDKFVLYKTEVKNQLGKYVNVRLYSSFERFGYPWETDDDLF